MVWMSRHAFRVLAILFLLASGACTDIADTFPLNAAAKQLGPVKVSFVRTGVGSGPVTITMADGEVLTDRAAGAALTVRHESRDGRAGRKVL